MFLMTWIFFLSSPGEYAAFPDSTCVSCSGCFLLQSKQRQSEISVLWDVLTLLGRPLKKAIYIEIPEKIIFLSGKLLSGLLEICFLESFNCKSNTTSQSLEEFFRFALLVSLNSLNCLATGLPESLRCDDETLFWDLYPVLSFRNNCCILFKGDKVKYPENFYFKKTRTNQKTPNK